MAISCIGWAPDATKPVRASAIYVRFSAASAFKLGRPTTGPAMSLPARDPLAAPARLRSAGARQIGTIIAALHPDHVVQHAADAKPLIVVQESVGAGREQVLTFVHPRAGNDHDVGVYL